MEINDQSTDPLDEKTPPGNVSEPGKGLSPGLDEDIDSGAPTLAALTQHIAVSQAADLARLGHYSQAETLLDSLEGKETAEILDLKARICAQQGRLSEAQSLWERALALEPGNPDYLAGLEYVQNAAKPVRTRRIFSVGFWLGLALILVIILGLIWLNRWNQSMNKALADVSQLAQDAHDLNAQAIGENALREQAAGEQVLSTQAPSAPPGIGIDDLEKLRLELLGAAEVNQTSLAGQVAQLKSGQDEILAGLQPSAASQQEFQLEMPGVKSSQGAGGTQILFDEGLFAYGWTLKPAARQQLIEVGAKLAAYGEDIHIKLIGYQTDEESDKYFDLGLLRAVVVYDFLVKNTQLSEDVFSLEPQGSRGLPFPLDTAADRSRNLTVEMIVSQ